MCDITETFLKHLRIAYQSVNYCGIQNIYLLFMGLVFRSAVEWNDVTNEDAGAVKQFRSLHFHRFYTPSEVGSGDKAMCAHGASPRSSME